MRIVPVDGPRAGTSVVEMSGEGIEEPRVKYEEILAELGKSAEKTVSGFATIAGYVSYYVDGAEKKILKNRNRI